MCVVFSIDNSDDNDKVAYTLYNVSSRSAPYKTNIIMDGKQVSIGHISDDVIATTLYSTQCRC